MTESQFHGGYQILVVATFTSYLLRQAGNMLPLPMELIRLIPAKAIFQFGFFGLTKKRGYRCLFHFLLRAYQ